MSTKTVREVSQAKALIAQSKPRIGGRFVSTKDLNKEDDSENKETSTEEANGKETSAKRKRSQKQKEISKDELLYDTRVISEEDKEVIGDDSRKFFEMALLRSRTWSEGYKYARELKPLQHPSLQATQSKVEVEVTQKVLTWEWEGTTIESEAIEANKEEPTAAQKKLETQQVLDQVMRDRDDQAERERGSP